MVTLDISSKWKHSYSWRSITISCLSDSSSAWFSKYIKVHRGIYYTFKAQCCPRVTDCFFLNIAELSWNAFLGKPVQSTKLQSWCYWGQTNDSLQEILSSCTHKESKLLMDTLQFGLLLSSFLSNHSLSGKALYIQDP